MFWAHILAWGRGWGQVASENMFTHLLLLPTLRVKSQQGSSGPVSLVPIEQDGDGLRAEESFLL